MASFFFPPFQITHLARIAFFEPIQKRGIVGRGGGGSGAGQFKTQVISLLFELLGEFGGIHRGSHLHIFKEGGECRQKNRSGPEARPYPGIPSELVYFAVAGSKSFRYWGVQPDWSLNNRTHWIFFSSVR